MLSANIFLILMTLPVTFAQLHRLYYSEHLQSFSKI